MSNISFNLFNFHKSYWKIKADLDFFIRPPFDCFSTIFAAAISSFWSLFAATVCSFCSAVYFGRPLFLDVGVGHSESDEWVGINGCERAMMVSELGVCFIANLQYHINTMKLLQNIIEFKFWKNNLACVTKGLFIFYFLIFFIILINFLFSWVIKKGIDVYKRGFYLW